jgi:hypothetical protein
VFNLAVVRALPDADFAGFSTDYDLLSMPLRHTTLIAGVCTQINGSGHQAASHARIPHRPVGSGSLAQRDGRGN